MRLSNLDVYQSWTTKSVLFNLKPLRELILSLGISLLLPVEILQRVLNQMLSQASIRKGRHSQQCQLLMNPPHRPHQRQHQDLSVQSLLTDTSWTSVNPSELCLFKSVWPLFSESNSAWTALWRVITAQSVLAAGYARCPDVGKSTTVGYTLPS